MVLIVSQAVSAIKTVAALSLENTILDRYRVNLLLPAAVARKNAIFGSSVFAMSQSINFLANSLAFWYGGKLIVNREYDLKNMFTVFVAIIFGAMAAGRVFSYAPDVSKARLAARAVFRLFDTHPPIDADSLDGKLLNPKECLGHVKFENVKFHYPSRPSVKVLDGISIEVKPGQTAALVGPSGCGKSTCITLMERFYDPIGGSITLDGVDTRNINVKSFRSMVALVGQEPQLFSGTLRENILFGYPENDTNFPAPTDMDVERAAKDANIHDFIISLPLGYDTQLGSRGAQLSGGQKQRVAIARALIRNPRVLLLDEATSALDGESEKIVQAALDKAQVGRTTLTIAHRLSTIQNADIIYVFKDGNVIEKGDHYSLLQSRGVYYGMVNAQVLHTAAQ